MSKHQDLIHSDPLRFGLDGNNLTPVTAEFQIAEAILVLARQMHEYLRESTEPEAILAETYGALVRAVAVYWGSPESYDCPEPEPQEKPEPEPAPEVKRRIGLPFARKVQR